MARLFSGQTLRVEGRGDLGDSPRVEVDGGSWRACGSHEFECERGGVRSGERLRAAAWLLPHTP